jgi:uncharacterized protein (TIGR02391 family)
MEMPPEAVAAVLLPLIAREAKNQTSGFVPNDFVIGLVRNYYATEPRTSSTHTVADVLMEGMAFLERTGLLVQKPGEGVGVGMWHKLSRAGAELARRRPTELATIYTVDATALLHPKIAAVTLPELDRGPVGYSDAVLKAFREIEIEVRDAGSLAATDIGVDLMNKAFGPTGPLTDRSAPAAEQNAMRSLFAGAIAAFKNPPSHRMVDERDAKQVMRLLAFASALMVIVDRARSGSP